VAVKQISKQFDSSSQFKELNMLRTFFD